jgi:hypothetical protein
MKGAIKDHLFCIFDLHLGQITRLSESLPIALRNKAQLQPGACPFPVWQARNSPALGVFSFTHTSSLVGTHVAV